MTSSHINVCDRNTGFKSSDVLDLTDDVDGEVASDARMGLRVADDVMDAEQEVAAAVRAADERKRVTVRADEDGIRPRDVAGPLQARHHLGDVLRAAFDDDCSG